MTVLAKTAVIAMNGEPSGIYRVVMCHFDESNTFRVLIYLEIHSPNLVSDAD
jgi:hypothetical protein